MAAHAWAVDQKVWLRRPERTYQPDWGHVWNLAKVLKVGRQWGEVEYGNEWKRTIRFDLQTGKCETGYTGSWAGTLYADRTEILASLATRKALSELRLKLSSDYPDHIHLPAHITADKVMAAASLLGIELQPYIPRDE